MKLPELLTSKRFLPLFVTQFLGAFNDNLLKQALVMLITYHIASESEFNPQIMVMIAAGLFMLPYFLFSATAGQVADKYDRSKLAQISKIVEIGLMLLAAVGFLTSNSYFLLFVLFMMGAQATFFGPIKYALLPQHLKANELLSGNSYIEAGTFLGILLGTILGGFLYNDTYIVSGALIAFAVLGYLSSRSIPTAPAPEPELKLNKNIFQETLHIIGFARENSKVFLAILGASWFWLIGGSFMAQIPPYTKSILGADEKVVTLLFIMFSVGIGAGSFLCNKLLRGVVQSTFVPLAAIGITIFSIDLYFASPRYIPFDNILSSSEFLSHFSSWHILLDFFMIAVCGGVYIVPLYAIMQQRSNPAHTARIIAANNVLNALFMVFSAIFSGVMLKFGFTIPQVFLSIAIANGFVAIYICNLLPDALLRSIFRTILTFLYRVEVKGMENYKNAGERVLLIANHTSFLDAALIAAYMPEKISFAVNTHISRQWWLRPLLVLIDAFPLDPTNPMATKALIDELKHDKKCMIFPEGRITVTGSLMKIYEGPGMITDKSGAKLLPIRIDGAQYSPLSRLKGKVRIRLFPKITITILPPHDFNIPDEIKGRRRRQLASQQLYSLMSEMIYKSSHINQSLFGSLITAQEIHGREHIIAEDIERKPLNYGQFITRCFVLGRAINRLSIEEKAVGVLLPTAINTSITFFALHAFGKVPAMLNFTAGSAQIVNACKAANITVILSSRRFVEAGKLDVVAQEIAATGVKIVYLEDLRPKIGIFTKLFGLVASYLPRVFASRTSADAPAVILFTSGSEGTPKGVVLSHKNIQANRFQLSSRIDFNPQDKVFNCLPMFHSFGLTGGTLLPILSGIKTFYYPSPLHYRIVPELIYDTNSTILFGTDTFLSGYARFAQGYDLYSIRYVFAGAEKLKESTRAAYAEKYGVRIFEGYGATETSPVISTNTPMQNKVGSVGKLMPTIEHRLETVAGISEGGQLFVKGDNIMMGYLRAEKSGVLQPLTDGWYDTGDIVEFDADGYIFIKGRTKRFAKIGGEMVSLAAVETAINKLWANHNHAVVTVPDEKKGEQIVLLTEYENAARAEIIAHFRTEKLPELALPKRIIILKPLPLLGTGKIDYQKSREIALVEE